MDVTPREVTDAPRRRRKNPAMYGVLLLIPEGGGGGRDTLFADLSPRELYAVARAVAAGR